MQQKTIHSLGAMREWIKKHGSVLGIGIAGGLVFLWFMLRGSGSSKGAKPTTLVTGSPPSGGGSTGSGLLNLGSGQIAPTPSNLMPPNCGPGQTAVPIMTSGGPGQPSYQFGWKCTENKLPPAVIPSIVTLVHQARFGLLASDLGPPVWGKDAAGNFSESFRVPWGSTVTPTGPMQDGWLPIIGPGGTTMYIQKFDIAAWGPAGYPSPGPI